MKYKLKLTNPYFINFDDGDNKIYYDVDSYLLTDYIIQYVPAKNGGRPNGLILKDDEIKEFEVNISIDVFLNDEYGDEIANLATYITSSAQIAIVNGEIQLNIKPFTFDENINKSNLNNYDDDIDDETFIKAIKKLLNQTELNANSFKQFMLKEALSFAQLDD